MLMMLRSEVCFPSVDHNNTYLNPSSISPINHSYRFRLSFKYKHIPFCKFTSARLLSCKAHSHNNNGHNGNDDGSKPQHSHVHDDFLQASLLLPETVRHYHLLKRGFREEVKQYSGPFAPFSTKTRGLRNDVNSIGLSTLSRFRQPTIFLKISCQGDFLLPIIVGEFAVETLIDSVDEDDHEDSLNQFQFARNLVVGLGYEVKMVKITKRVVNTYFARVYFGKVGRREILSVDARPSDAINVAKRCKAPIYVNKEIVLADAVRISYGTGRVRDTKPVYDVLLDSPMEGPDLLVEELTLVQKMMLAVKEERFRDAAIWRDKLEKLRNS